MRNNREAPCLTHRNVSPHSSHSLLPLCLSHRTKQSSCTEAIDLPRRSRVQSTARRGQQHSRRGRHVTAARTPSTCRGRTDAGSGRRPTRLRHSDTRGTHAPPRPSAPRPAGGAVQKLDPVASMVRRRALAPLVCAWACLTWTCDWIYQADSSSAAAKLTFEEISKLQERKVLLVAVVSRARGAAAARHRCSSSFAISLPCCMGMSHGVCGWWRRL